MSHAKLLTYIHTYIVKTLNRPGVWGKEGREEGREGGRKEDEKKERRKKRRRKKKREGRERREEVLKKFSLYNRKYLGFRILIWLN